MPDPTSNGQRTPANVAAERLAIRRALMQDFREIGSTGLQAWSGTVVEEFLPQLRGKRGMRVYREMADNDYIAGAILFAIDMVLRQVDWRVEPNKKALAREKAARKLIEEQQGMGPIPDLDGAPVLDEPFTPEEGNPFVEKPDEKIAKAAPPFAKEDEKQAPDAEKEDEPNKPFGSKEPPRRYQEKPDVPLAEKDLDNIPAYEDLPDDEDLFPEKTESELVAEFVDSCMHDMSSTWEETISNVLSMLKFGYSVHEIVYKRRQGYNPSEPWIHSQFDDSKIGWRKFAQRSQETVTKWDIDESDGMPKGFFQQAPPKYKEVYIPFTKALLFRTTTEKGNPEGRSILRTAYRAWYFKKRFEEQEGIGVERDLAGIPTLWVPPQLLQKDASAEEVAMLNEFKRMGTNVKRNEQELLIFPLIYDEEGNKALEFELLTTGGRRNFDISAIITRYNQAIAMCVLADFVLLGHEKQGSHALATTKVDVFTAAVEAWVRNIADVFNKYAIPRLLDANGINQELCPKLAYGKISRIPLADIGAFVVQMAQAQSASFLDDELEDHLRRVAGLPERPAEDKQDAKDKADEQHAADIEAKLNPPEFGAIPGAKPIRPGAPGGGGGQVASSTTPGAVSTAKMPTLPGIGAAQRGKSRGPYTGESGRK